jgi:hypothetical protein
MTRLLCAIALISVISGCATAGKINQISLGMTKAEAIAVMGDPVSTRATEGVEFLTYRLSETADDAARGITTPYYVRIVDGRVDAYGREGDFGTTIPATIRVLNQ